MRNLPLFLPIVLATALLGLALAQAVARWTRSAVPAAWLLIASLGLIAGATLTPLQGPLVTEGPASVCNLSRLSLLPLSVYLRFGDPGLNVALFVPLGISVGLMGPGPVKWLSAIGGFVLPVAIELTQLSLQTLHRACESGDVIDNGAGFAIGLAGSLLLGVVLRSTGVLDGRRLSAVTDGRDGER